MEDEELRRFNQMEAQVQENTLELKELQIITIGPPPHRNNGIRGDLKKLENNFKNCIDRHEDKDKSISEAKMNLKGIYIMGGLQFAGSILVALIAGGYFK